MIGIERCYTHVHMMKTTNYNFVTSNVREILFLCKTFSKLKIVMIFNNILYNTFSNDMKKLFQIFSQTTQQTSYVSIQRTHNRNKICTSNSPSPSRTGGQQQRQQQQQKQQQQQNN